MRTRHALTPALLALFGCQATHPTLRITDEQAAQLKPGMTVEEVRAIIGRPWQLVVEPLRPRRETHRYVMEREPYKAKEWAARWSAWSMEDVTLMQYRVMDIRYVDGKLVAE